jgi:23S rRNA pseudouridine1911/1915/1917 synthase
VEGVRGIMASKIKKEHRGSIVLHDERSPTGRGASTGESLEESVVRLDVHLRTQRPDLSWRQIRDWIASGKVFIQGKAVREPGFLVKRNLPLDLRMNAPRRVPEKDLMGNEREIQSPVVKLHFEDAQILVVDKRAGVDSVPFMPKFGGRSQEKTSIRRDASSLSLLEYLERQKRQRLHVVHRLDRETSGLLVFARTDLASRALTQQFRFHRVHRRYLAAVWGSVEQELTLDSPIARDRGDGLRGAPLRGARVDPGHLQEAITHVRPLEHRLIRGKPVTLVECRLETGRTHQIRIHLSEAGHRLVGEGVYGFPSGGFESSDENAAEKREAPRILLHAAELGFLHPTKDELRLQWQSPLPDDFSEWWKTCQC